MISLINPYTRLCSSLGGQRQPLTAITLVALSIKVFGQALTLEQAQKYLSDISSPAKALLARIISLLYEESLDKQALRHGSISTLISFCENYSQAYCEPDLITNPIIRNQLIRSLEGSFPLLTADNQDSYSGVKIQALCQQARSQSILHETRPAVERYMLRLEILYALGILRGKVLYPCIGNDIFPSYWTSVYGLNDNSGIGGIAKTTQAQVEKDASAAGLPARFVGQAQPIKMIIKNAFYPAAYLPMITSDNGIDVLFLKGFMYWTTIQTFGHDLTHSGGCRNFLSRIDESIKPGGFILTFSLEEAELFLFITAKLGYQRFFADPDLAETGKILATGRSDCDYVSGAFLYLGNSPIHVFQKL